MEHSKANCDLDLFPNPGRQRGSLRLRGAVPVAAALPTQQSKFSRYSDNHPFAGGAASLVILKAHPLPGNCIEPRNRPGFVPGTESGRLSIRYVECSGNPGIKYCHLFCSRSGSSSGSNLGPMLRLRAAIHRRALFSAVPRIALGVSGRQSPERSQEPG